MFLADKKAQQKFIWGTAAGLIVFSGIILCAAPVTAPVAALTGSAMGSTAAAGTASTAVVSTSVGAAGGTLAVARAAAFTATRSALSPGLFFKTMAGSAAIGGSSMTFIKSLEEMNSRNSMLNYSPHSLELSPFDTASSLILKSSLLIDGLRL